MAGDDYPGGWRTHWRAIEAPRNGGNPWPKFSGPTRWSAPHARPYQIRGSRAPVLKVTTYWWNPLRGQRLRRQKIPNFWQKGSGQASRSWYHGTVVGKCLPATAHIRSFSRWSSAHEIIRTRSFGLFSVPAPPFRLTCERRGFLSRCGRLSWCITHLAERLVHRHHWEKRAVAGVRTWHRRRPQPMRVLWSLAEL